MSDLPPTDGSPATSDRLLAFKAAPVLAAVGSVAGPFLLIGLGIASYGLKLAPDSVNAGLIAAGLTAWQTGR